MQKFDPLDFQQMQLTILDYLQKHWKLFFWEGIFFVVLGTLAIIAPHVFTMGITIFHLPIPDYPSVVPDNGLVPLSASPESVSCLHNSIDISS